MDLALLVPTVAVEAAEAILDVTRTGVLYAAVES